ncbi:hypothetical protein PTH_0911 [Pelotomaculum thermopropionicum SI]|uniref:Uncharacterized protein n=1 Tax=Pelotomaculum thermopropionicum (strain DSM 13744 / JCM 10971 / SI) TaxID=370438 RepID=A5D3V0_PELTS|nr:hypothetical protein PTH_0911 [Pelotomaculum thermopropionicum SI]
MFQFCFLNFFMYEKTPGLIHARSFLTCAETVT